MTSRRLKRRGPHCRRQGPIRFWLCLSPVRRPGRRATDETGNMQPAQTAMEGNPGTDVAPGKPAASQMLHVLTHGLASLYRCAYRLLGNKADAEDAVQDALLAAYKHLSEFRADAKMSTWLHAIVANCARMQLRKRSRTKHLSLDSRIGEDQEYSVAETLVDHRASPEDECRCSRLNARLMKCAERLSPTLRRTFHLRFVQNLSIDETARVLGIPSGSVKAHTARARAKLKKSLRELHAEPRDRGYRR